MLNHIVLLVSNNIIIVIKLNKYRAIGLTGCYLLIYHIFLLFIIQIKHNVFDPYRVILSVSNNIICHTCVKQAKVFVSKYLH